MYTLPSFSPFSVRFENIRLKNSRFAAGLSWSKAYISFERAAYIYNVQFFTLRDGEHLFYLRINGEGLFLVLLGRFSGIEAVFDLFSGNNGWAAYLGIGCLGIHTYINDTPI